MTEKTMAHVTLSLDDVRRAGGVKQALEKWCEDSDDTSCGVIGSSFSTSGPGPGWSKQHTVSDFALRAFESGAMYYLDSDDGRLATAKPVEKVEEDEDTEAHYVDAEGNTYEEHEVTYDGSGGYVLQDIEWSEESVVCLECPNLEDAIYHPALVAEMAQAVIDYHGDRSDRAEWKRLIVAIRDAAEAVKDIDTDDLE